MNSESKNSWQQAAGSRQWVLWHRDWRQQNCQLPTANCQLPSRRGLSIIELLISLAISALLLTAVAVAFSASSQVIEHNDQFFRASQAARVSMNQLLTQIRRCTTIDVANSKTINLLTDNGADISFVYDDSATNVEDKVLKLITNDVAADPDYTLASNISALAFTEDTAQDANGTTYTVRVAITITVEVGGNQVRLSGSAAPRRAQTYSN
jgi:prepilin-type N-terminal cleavage/methylation domain-containing protein